MSTTEPTEIHYLAELPGRGDRLVHEGRTYVVNETSLAIKDGIPEGAEWVSLFTEERNGVLVVVLRAIEVKDQSAEASEGSAA